MLTFIDGQVVIFPVETNIDLYYSEYQKEFGEISRAQWEGSQEYSVAYTNAQRDTQNATLFEQGLQTVFDSISEQNESIRRPAVLYSKVSERFKEVLGYVATIRVADDTNKGIVAICVDYVSDTGGPLDQSIAELIVGEMLPAGQYVEGDISFPITISNGQVITAQWKAPEPHDIDFKIELTIDRNSQSPQDPVDVIVDRFLANFAAQNPLGNDITPDTYYQIERDAPWASQIVTTYSLDGGTDTGEIYRANYDDKFNATLDPVNVIILDENGQQVKEPF